MSVAHVEFLVEEPSMAAVLRRLVPRIVPKLAFEVHEHPSKQNLLKHLPGRLRGYAEWLPDNWRIVVVVDRDDDDCKKLKANLDKLAIDAGLATRSRPRRGTSSVVNRVAIEELEAWFFGDWKAVRAAYRRVANILSRAQYRRRCPALC